MKYLITIMFLVNYLPGFSQDQLSAPLNDQQGKLYLYWGWNRCAYTTSDIHFKGENIDFTLENVKAKDRQSPFNLKTYFKPSSITIPQYNFRVGYFFKSNYDVSFGIDHMKYVVQANQTVKINGSINETETIYDGNYTNENIQLNPDFLKLEHTDGLNFVNVEIRRSHNIASYKRIKINLTEGLGSGVLIPRTDATLFNRERNDEFHLSGYGFSAVAGIHINYYKSLFIQTELKGGFINLPDITISKNELDKASQKFFFSQVNIVFGASFNLFGKTDKHRSSELN